jgi:hypothetical protein
VNVLNTQCCFKTTHSLFCVAANSASMCSGFHFFLMYVDVDFVTVFMPAHSVKMHKYKTMPSPFCLQKGLFKPLLCNSVMKEKLLCSMLQSLILREH